MQLIPRYLLNDRTLVISNDVGFSVEFRPVYSRTIKIYKGVTNKVQFRLLNADQKPIELTTAPWIVVFDEERNKIFEKEAVSQDDNSSAATRGMFYVEFDDAELLDLKQQKVAKIRARKGGVCGLMETIIEAELQVTVQPRCCSCNF